MINRHFPFDADRAHGRVSELCFPRRVGTAQERRAAAYVAREFQDAGLHLTRQPFCVSFFAVEVGGRLIYTLCALLIAMGTVLVADRPLLACLAFGVAAVLVNRAWYLLGGLGRCWRPFSTSENLLAAPQDLDGPARVIFMAHYDTKSQLLPTGIRVGLITLTTLLAGMLAVISLGLTLGDVVVSLVIKFSFLIVVAMGLSVLDFSFQ